MISLFVRSYPKDYTWLAYSVKSMRKNLKGVNEKVLVVPKGQEPSPYIQDYFDKVHYVNELHQDGYISQQLDKIRAHEFVTNEYILYSDSDCIYYNEFDATQHFIDKRIKLYVTEYSRLTGDVLTWQEITAEILGQIPKWEFMRCFPILHLSEVGAGVQQQVFDYASTLKSRRLSEFNCMGFYAFLNYSHRYRFIDTTIELPTQLAKQYWSWGGISDNIKEELNVLTE